MSHGATTAKQSPPLRFLYRVTLGKDWVVKGVVSPKKEMKLADPVEFQRQLALTHRVGRVRQTAMGRTRAGPQIPRTVHAPRGDQ